MIETFRALNRFLAQHPGLRGKISVVLRADDSVAAQELRILMNAEAESMLPGVRHDAGLNAPSPHSGHIAGIPFEITHG